MYRGTSLKRSRLPLGPYSRTLPRALWGAYGEVRCFMSEELYIHAESTDTALPQAL